MPVHLYQYTRYASTHDIITVPFFEFMELFFRFTAVDLAQTRSSSSTRHGGSTNTTKVLHKRDGACVCVCEREGTPGNLPSYTHGQQRQYQQYCGLHAVSQVLHVCRVSTNASTC